MASDDEVAARLLRTIADMLRVPVERFYEAARPGEFADTEECLRLWYMLRTDESRAAVLDYLRRALTEETI